jgi:riboflavin kinase/FMN adenylyltransferase
MGYVATIGMFDGVHKGHQFVLRQVVECARERGLQSMAITFDHTVRREQVLTPLDEKLLLLSKTDIDRVEVLPFTKELKQMTARQFMEQVLKEQLDVKVLLTGYDNRFGHNREEGFDDYVRYGHELGIEVKSLPPAPSDAEGKGDTVSSSLIRQLLRKGRVSEAAQALGFPYTILGTVEHGEHVGTRLGFPTANLTIIDERQLIPAPGVYAVKVRLENSVEQKHGMMNIGNRPTFDGHRQTLEAHIFQLHENLYGQRLLVSFVKRLRDEQRFDSIDALKEQLQKDVIAAQEALLADNS